ncbi:MAG TPA: FUSC family protein [Solirubrobacteraceae bacterium]|nr:FUSC family protein [Solirubrobacteraceae bacterium]
MQGARQWLRTHDPGYTALRRAGRAAILMPALVALGVKVIGNPVMTYFLSFGSFAMLLLVDFAGSRLDRLRSQALLGLTCVVIICLGTLASRSTALSVIGMFVVGFAVLFSGVVSSVIASATTPLLLAFILPVSLPGSVSQIPDRIAGWGIAATVSLFAITFLWPSAVAYPVEGRAIAAFRGLAARIRAEIAWMLDGDEVGEADYETAKRQAEVSIADLDRLFLATPYRPTGLSTKARAEIRLVDELRWLNDVVLLSGATVRPREPNRAVCRVKLAAAGVLERAAEALGSEPGRAAGAVGELATARRQLRDALQELEAHAVALANERAHTDSAFTATVVSALNPSFRAQELAYITEQIGANVEFAVAASTRSWLGRLAGRQPQGFAGPLSSARERALAHAQLNSSWLHNSLRGSTALALAVLVAQLTSVQHGFWVVFGTLAVLRSNALATGQNVLRALLGTTVGFIIGGALVALIGTNTVVLWVLLPLVVLFAGLAPSTISFEAGQAAFTLTLLVLFNLLLPVGWRLGLVRVEDVAIGGAVSLAVGLLFWPRGAAVDLGRALGRAYLESSNYLQQAVAYGIACCRPAGGAPPTAPRALGQQAAAAARRLDDTFRGYLVERGTKHAPLAEVARLVTGVAGLRLAGDAVLDLWDDGVRRDGQAMVDYASRAAAERELLASAGQVSAWYASFAASLSGGPDVPEPLHSDGVAAGRLVEAVAQDLRDSDGRATATGVRVIWTGDHLDAARRLQETLVGPARTAVAAERQAVEALA